MAAPYTSVSATSYNASPPPDDGSTTAANEITWAGIKTKLADPLHAEADAINANILLAFGKIFGATISALSATYTVIGADQGKMLACTGTFTVSLPAAATIAAPFCIAVKNVGSGTITIDPNGSELIDGFATITVGPAGWAIIITDGAAWRTLTSGVGLTLGAATTFNVATTGSDTTGDGTSGAPWLTLQHAYDTLQSRYNLNGHTATISVADGTYTAGVIASGPIPGQVGPSVVQFVGNTGTPANCIIDTGSTASTFAFKAAYGAAFQVNGFKMQASGTTTIAMEAFMDGYIGFLNVNFGAYSGGAGCYHMCAAQNGVLQALGNYTVSGAADIHIMSQYNSTATIVGETVTVSGTPAFTTGFAVAQICGSLAANGVTFSGSATGPRYAASMNGVIFTNSGGASYFPGNSAGSTATGGVYA